MRSHSSDGRAIRLSPTSLPSSDPFGRHVLVAVFSDTLSDGNGQHQAMAMVAREAYDAASDTMRFNPARYGPAWSPAKLYRHGPGLAIDANEYDASSGRTYADIALESGHSTGRKD